MISEAAGIMIKADRRVTLTALSPSEPAILDLDPSGVQDIEQRRVLNIKAAYVLANRAVMEPDWCLDLSSYTECDRPATPL